MLADDSGLEIDYLNKEPGIYSARYMGEDTSYHIKNANLISRLEGVPDEKRTARFVCAIAAVLPNGEVLHSEGTIVPLAPFQWIGEMFSCVPFGIKGWIAVVLLACTMIPADMVRKLCVNK